MDSLFSIDEFQEDGVVDEFREDDVVDEYQKNGTGDNFKRMMMMIMMMMMMMKSKKTYLNELDDFFFCVFSHFVRLVLLCIILASKY
jgi:hypothetical protein